MDSAVREPNPLDFPRRMFAIGEEPVGVRVTPYHKPSCISKILNALDEEEVDVIRGSSFGKLLSIAEKPSFSGRFGRFLISRQLKVSKKHETWFIFAGKPVRFSLREFSLVTGLNCQGFPKHSKKRSNKNISEKPYWGELFGSMKEVPVSYVVTMLKRKMVTDPDIRIKYALLALLSAVVLPTSHNPRISPEHAEKIKNVDKFLEYPWGRASFELLMSSIKERNEVSLSQNTIALKGFVMSIQLVMIEAVPSLIGVVRDGASSASEADSADEEEICDDQSEGKKTINTVHVREIDTACKALVISIISPGVDMNNSNPDLSWADEEHDAQVDNLVKSIEEGFPFSNSHFTGGATRADVIRMREQAKKETMSRKTHKVNPKQTVGDSLDAEYVATIVKSSVSAELASMSQQIKNLSENVNTSQIVLLNDVKELFNSFQSHVANLITTPCRRIHVQSIPGSSLGKTATPNDPNPLNVATTNASHIIQDALQFAKNATSTSGMTSTDGAPTGNNMSIGQKDPCSGTVCPDPSSQSKEPDEGPHVQPIPDDPLSQSLETEKVPHVQPCSDVTAENMVDTVVTPINNNSFTAAEDVVSNSVTHVPAGLTFPDPSFSIGLTQLEKSDPNVANPVVEPLNEDPPSPDNVNEAPVGNRKSKRPRVVPRALVGDYHCDKRFLTRAWEAYVTGISTTPDVNYSSKFVQLSEKFASTFVIDFGSLTLDSSEMSTLVDRSSHLSAKVIDVLIHHTRSLFLSNPEHIQSKNSVFLDTQFVSLLAKAYPKFTKATRKDRFRFPAALCDLLVADCSVDDVTRFYFPFNFDKQHWVGLCVDWSAYQVIVFDCNASRMVDKLLAEELRHISVMWPYLLRQAGKQLSGKDLKPLTIDRPRSIPQNNTQIESGITTILLIQAHAVGGIDLCQCITPELLESEVQRTAVMIYEENIGAL